jgi:hypothetical protein
LQNVVRSTPTSIKRSSRPARSPRPAAVRTFHKKQDGHDGRGGRGAWFAIQELAGPSLKLMQEQFGYLFSLLGQ